MRIETTRLKMAPIQQQDWELFEALHSDPAVIALCFDQPEVKELEQKFCARLTPWTRNLDSWLCLVMTDKSTGTAIGITGFIVRENVAEVGYLLLPEFHGNQYGTESLRALLDWADINHEFAGYKAVVTEGNVGSQRVLLKCGFILENIVDEAYEIGGRLYADHIYRRC
ncbi:GNAT family N-acetyltransferase [Vibrio tapetis subsp. quintayensis]|uniref:GNAT family N-acetyltransferase n=1 Tax=Vibrio tapetis TaxID=52443 RepID=UPI0025B2DCA8|nr:GNAT family N-acetyltransferase [Vibrio tapetis]MDN3682268.1 GNAT family N-acetyltransferase [Vibrio tapetis subsp. quintayensis]